MPRNTQNTLDAMKVAILVADGFEQVELTEPRKALDEAGAVTRIVSPQDGSVRSWKHHDQAEPFEVDLALQHARAEDFDALLLPGGVVNPDALRIDGHAVAFVRGFVDANKPIAAICHGPWTLIEAQGVKGRQMTSWPSLHTDLKNAGAHWIDEPVVVDGTLVTSRKPDDLPLFNSEMLKLFASERRRSAAAAH
jgi:protease I